MTGQSKKSYLVISLSILLCLLMSSCSNFGISMNNHKSIFQHEESEYVLKKDQNNKITDISLILAFLDVANQNATIEEVCSAIPQSIKEDISLHDFTIFANSLYAPQNYHLTKFNRVSGKLKSALVLEIVKDQPNLLTLAENSEYYELYYENNENPQESFSRTLAIQHDAEGNAYLSGEWMRLLNKILEFSKLYFEALDNHDQEMLSWLLAQGDGEEADDKIRSIEANKATLLIDYYRLEVKTDPLASIPLALLPNKIVYLQELENSEDLSYSQRNCTFRQNNQNISVTDPYPQKLKKQHLNIYYKDNFLLSWSSNGIRQIYYGKVLNSILGEPLIIKSNLQDPLSEGSDFYRITYPEVSFLIKGEGNNLTKNWQGRIERIEINENSKNISLGNSLASENSIYYNMPVLDFYKQYPFSPEADFIIQGNDQDEKMEMIVQVDSQNVKNIILRAVYDSRTR